MGKETRTASRETQSGYNLELAVMNVITNHTGKTWSLREIADVCGVSYEAIRLCEKKALRKIRMRETLFKS
jgi:DNA-directed RNA polymerase sigma subunit (sigma70/sigma32)